MERLLRVWRIWREHGFCEGSCLLIAENSRHFRLARRLGALMTAGEAGVLQGALEPEDVPRQSARYNGCLEKVYDVQDRILSGDFTGSDILYLERTLHPLFAASFSLSNAVSQLVADLREALDVRMP